MIGMAGVQYEPQTTKPDLPWAMGDEDLLLEYRLSGDPEVFSELVARYETGLFGYLCRYTGDASAAEDIFQATFLRVHLKCDAFEQGRALRPWLYKIATNLAIDALRRNRRHRRLRFDFRDGSDDRRDTTLLSTLPGSDLGPAEEYEQDERRRWVRTAVDSLPDHLRGPILLVYFEGLKYREAAEVLALPVGTLKSRMHAALEKLKNFSS